MKSSFTSRVELLLAAVIGCTQATSGGPGATGKSPSYRQDDDASNVIKRTVVKE